VVYPDHDQEVPYPSETQSAHIHRVIKEIEKQLPAMGDESALYVSFVAQFHKAVGRYDKAAEAYRRLIDMPNLFGWKPVPFALKASTSFKNVACPLQRHLTITFINLHRRCDS
jgi:hypothetical protein